MGADGEGRVRDHLLAGTPKGWQGSGRVPHPLACRPVRPPGPQVYDTLQRVLQADPQNIMAQAWACEWQGRAGRA